MLYDIILYYSTLCDYLGPGLEPALGAAAAH